METEEYTNEIAADDSTETLVEEIHARRDSRPDDIIAMQAVLCILLALLLIAANYFYPDTAEELYGKITALTSDPKNLIPNPIDLIISYLDKL